MRRKDVPLDRDDVKQVLYRDRNQFSMRLLALKNGINTFITPHLAVEASQVKDMLEGRSRSVSIGTGAKGFRMKLDTGQVMIYSDLIPPNMVRPKVLADALEAIAV